MASSATNKYYAVFDSGEIKEVRGSAYLAQKNMLCGFLQVASHEKTGSHINTIHKYYFLNEHGPVDELPIGDVIFLDVRTSKNQWYDQINIRLKVSDETGLIEYFHPPSIDKMGELIADLANSQKPGTVEVYKMRNKINELELEVERLKNEMINPS